MITPGLFSKSNLTDQFSSVQFKMVSMRSEGPYTRHPVVWVSPMLPLKPFQCWSDCPLKEYRWALPLSTPHLPNRAEGEYDTQHSHFTQNNNIYPTLNRGGMYINLWIRFVFFIFLTCGRNTFCFSLIGPFERQHFVPELPETLMHSLGLCGWGGHVSKRLILALEHWDRKYRFGVTFLYSVQFL